MRKRGSDPSFLASDIPLPLDCNTALPARNLRAAFDSKDASRDIWSAPDGTRRYEIRRAADGGGSQLYYDSRGLVVGVMGSLPTDVKYALRWGTEVDGWSCGVAVSNGLIYVHLKNGTQTEASASQRPFASKAGKTATRTA